MTSPTNLRAPLRAPFPYFGGKSRVADVVWRAFGDVANYVEPFAGSLAVLLSRPHEPGLETVNDKDALVANFWRSTRTAPDDVAQHCDWPVLEVDLEARHAWLVDRIPTLRDRLRADPEFFDAQVAGWWVWGLSAWIGGGWCAESRCVHRRRPRLQRGTGVHRQLPPNGDAAPCLEWFRALQTRLRRVRVCCGDWMRVITDSVIGVGSQCAVFLDPPYPGDVRDPDIYAVDDGSVADRVAEWAVEHGDDDRLRIAFCSYEDAHTFPDSWTKFRWMGPKGFAGSDNANRYRECIWFSAHCLPCDPAQRELFAVRP